MFKSRLVWLRANPANNKETVVGFVWVEHWARSILPTVVGFVALRLAHKDMVPTTLSCARRHQWKSLIQHIPSEMELRSRKSKLVTWIGTELYGIHHTRVSRNHVGFG